MGIINYTANLQCLYTILTGINLSVGMAGITSITYAFFTRKTKACLKGSVFHGVSNGR